MYAAASAMDSRDILTMNDQAASVVLQSTVLNVEPGDAAALQQSLDQYADQLDGYLAAISDYDAVDEGQMVAMMQNLNLGGEDFNLGDTVLQSYDVSGMVASLDLSNLEDIGARRLLNTTSLLTDLDVAESWDAETALNVLNIVGPASAVTLEALEGIASALGPVGASQLDDDDLVTVVQNLDFDARNASALLGNFSVGALDAIDPGSLVQLELDEVAGLLNSGREIYQVGEENLAAAVDTLLDNDGLELLNPSAFSSAIAGLSGGIVSGILSDGVECSDRSRHGGRRPVPVRWDEFRRDRWRRHYLRPDRRPGGNHLGGWGRDLGLPGGRRKRG